MESFNVKLFSGSKTFSRLLFATVPNMNFCILNLLRWKTFIGLLENIFFFINYSIYLFLAVLDLHCCTWAFSSCKWGLLSSCSVWVSHCDGFSCCRAQALGCVGSAVVAHRLNCPVVCGILPDQGSGLCPLHWQMDS